MAHQFIVDLKEGMEIQQYFIVRQAEARRTKNGKPYLNLVLADRSGAIRAKLWSNVLREFPGPFVVGDCVGAVAEVRSYQGELELIVQKIWTLAQIREKKDPSSQEPKDFDLSLLLATTPYDPVQMWEELVNLAAAVLTSPLRELVSNIMERHAAAWQSGPAARRNHHAYQGGLLEHTWFVARLAHRMSEIYPQLNQQLVVAGAILHDIGKLQELAQPHAPDYTVAGQLVGHIVLGWDLIRQEASAMAFPDPDLLLQLEHIILSHHGQREFGSPVLPKTREALLVYLADDLDAKLKIMEHHLEADTSDRVFTPYHWLLQRELYKAGVEAATGNEEEEPEADKF